MSKMSKKKNGYQSEKKLRIVKYIYIYIEKKFGFSVCLLSE